MPAVMPEVEFGFVPGFVVEGTSKTYARLVDAVESLSRPQLDLPALNVFLRTRLFLDGDTPFVGIRKLSPNPQIEAAQDISRERAIEGYIDLFRQAVARRSLEGSVLALSGGCDSRHVLLELSRQKRLPESIVTVAIPGRGHSEVEIAAELAARFGLKHEIKSPPVRGAAIVQDEIWKNEAGNFMTLEHGWFACAAKDRAKMPWWDGIAGDVLSAGLFLEEWNLSLFEQERLDELADRLVDKRPVPYFRDQSLFPREHALQRIYRELLRHRAAANPVGSFYFWNRTRVTIAAATFGMLAEDGRTVLTPYLDYDLWRFLSALPARLLIDHRLHVDTVARAYPEFAAVPYFQAKDKKPVPASLMRAGAAGLLGYMVRTGGASARLFMGLRTLRGLIDPQFLGKSKWLLPLTVYCSELERLAG